MKARGKSLITAWHGLCGRLTAMKTACGSLPKRMRWEIVVSLVLIIGIFTALILPSPSRFQQGAGKRDSLFMLMEGNYLSPLYSSAQAIRTLNGAAKQFALFAGYDDFHTRVDFNGNAYITSVTRYTGDLLSVLGLRFESKASAPSRDRFMYISQAFRDKMFGPGQEVIGATLMMNNISYSIAGVTRSFSGLLSNTEVWVPIRSKSLYGEISSMRVIGALQTDSTWRLAQKALNAIFSSDRDDQAFAEATGAKLIPLARGVPFSEESTIVIGSVFSSETRWPARDHQVAAFPRSRGS